MRFAYADPPYLGCCGLYGHEHGTDGRCWNEIATHEALIARVHAEFPDGWALSLHEPSLRRLLPICPEGVRVSPWVKPFAVFKPSVNPAYAWEPVIWFGGRKPRRDEPTVRDWCAANITLKRGLTGAKPEAFCWWLLQLLGAEPDDEFVDLFPGTGVMGDVYRQFQRQRRLA